MPTSGPWQPCRVDTYPLSLQPILPRQETPSTVQMVAGGATELSRGHWLARRVGITRRGCCLLPDQDIAVPGSLGNMVVVWGDATRPCMDIEALTPKTLI